MAASSFDIVRASAYSQHVKHVQEHGDGDALFIPPFIDTISLFVEDAMQKRSLFLAVALAAAAAPTALKAQSPNPLADRFTVAAAFGGHSGAADLNPSGTANWRLGWVGSIDANYWVQPKIGLRVSGTWAQDSLEGATISGRGKFNKFAYDANVVLRYPLPAGKGTFVPYVLGGAGAVSVHQLESDSTWTKFAANFGAGIGYRISRIGVRAEARDYVYKFDRYGFDKIQHDVAWQGGVTYSF